MISLVFICDDGYVMPTSVAITSVVKNVNECNIYILCDNVSVDNKNILLSLSTKNVNVYIVDVDSSKYQGLEKKYSSVTKSSLLKFDIPNLLPNVNKVLYLDGDVIVCKNLEKLYNTDISMKYAAVVRDGPKKDIAGGKLHSYYGCRDYFNSGVMLLNLKLMRKNEIAKKLIEFRLNEYNYFMDQDAFNRVIGLNVLQISVVNDFLLHLISFRNPDFSLKQISHFYNIEEYENIDYLFEDVVIFHYTFDKPWKYYDIPQSELWYSYYKLSPFAAKPLYRTSYLTKMFHSKPYTLGRKLVNIIRFLIRK